MKLDRRELIVSGVAGLVSVGLGAPAVAARGAPGVALSDWAAKLRRIGQVNFNERDVVDGDPKAWADYWATCKVEAVLLSVSSTAAFYPTKIPFFRPSPFLKGRDFFGECVSAAKRHGIRIIGRMSPDFQWADKATLAAHPLWFQRRRDGGVSYMEGSDSELAQTCVFGGNYSDFTPAVMREVIDRYKIDGIYTNGWPNMGIQSCYCDTCRAIGEPGSAKYSAALLDRNIELFDLFARVVRKGGRDRIFIGNFIGGVRAEKLDTYQLAHRAMYCSIDAQSRDAIDTPLWDALKTAKYARCMGGEGNFLLASAAYAKGPVVWRNVSDTPAEVEYRMCQTLAGGGAVSYHFPGLEQGQREDRRWQALGQRFFSWQAANAAHFENVRSLADVAVVVASRSLVAYPAPGSDKKTDPLNGICQALIEGRFTFDFVHEDGLATKDLSRYKCLILPNVPTLDAAQTAAIMKFAEAGGSVLATFETGLYDKDGKSTGTFALSNLLGIHAVGARQNRKPGEELGAWSSHVLRIAGQHPITAGFGDTRWIAGPVWRVPIDKVPSPILTTIDPYPSFPTEAVYIRGAEGDQPGIVVREVGTARLAYLPGNIEATFWRTGNADLCRLLTNTVTWLLANRAQTVVTGDELVSLDLWQTTRGYALHLVNFNNPQAYRGKVTRFFPSGPQQVTLTLPNSLKIKSASLLKQGAAIAFSQNGGMVKLMIPSIEAYEVLALES